MNHVIKRIALIVADPCDGYTCLCATCQQNVADLEKAYNDSNPYAGHLDADELAATDPLNYAEDGITEFDTFGPLCPCTGCRADRQSMNEDRLADQSTLQLPTVTDIRNYRRW